MLDSNSTTSPPPQAAARPAPFTRIRLRTGHQPSPAWPAGSPRHGARCGVFVGVLKITSGVCVMRIHSLPAFPQAGRLTLEPRGGPDANGSLLLTAPVSGHRVMINGHILCCHRRFPSRVVRGCNPCRPELRSSGAQRREDERTGQSAVSGTLKQDGFVCRTRVGFRMRRPSAGRQIRTGCRRARAGCRL
jgi:hypothetical protein